jgi:hypothetical protein
VREELLGWLLPLGGCSAAEEGLLLGWLLPLGGCSAAEEGLLLAGEGRRRCWNRLEKEETEGRGDRSLFFGRDGEAALGFFAEEKGRRWNRLRGRRLKGRRNRRKNL